MQEVGQAPGPARGVVLCRQENAFKLSGEILVKGSLSGAMLYEEDAHMHGWVVDVEW